jgi:hypothetical protein
VRSNTNSTHAGADDTVKAVLNYIQTKVQAGEEVQLVGFGTFKQVERAARTVRNLITLVFGISIVAPISEGQIGEPTTESFSITSF